MSTSQVDNGNTKSVDKHRQGRGCHQQTPLPSPRPKKAHPAEWVADGGITVFWNRKRTAPVVEEVVEPAPVPAPRRIPKEIDPEGVIPYGTKQECEKCGSKRRYLQFKSAAYQYPYSVYRGLSEGDIVREHLHASCSTCSHSWNEWPKDYVPGGD